MNTTALIKGELVNDLYHVDFFIGQGAFGEVYRVRHKFFDDLQVMKVFKQEYVEKTKFSQVVNEGRVLAKLTHANIVRVFDMNTFMKRDRQHYFITMGFVSGESLARLLKRKIQLPVAAAVSIVIDVLQGLDCAHSHTPPIIHRDINPDNILLSYEHASPVGLLCDFGLSMLLDEHSHLAGAAGRYLYFAPECFWDCYLPCSDVFSAGVVLYKMLTGIHPWEYDLGNHSQDQIQDIVRMINSGRRQPYKRPSYFNEDIDQSLEGVLSKALEGDMEKRYRAAGEFLAALKEIHNTSPPPGHYWR